MSHKELTPLEEDMFINDESEVYGGQAGAMYPLVEIDAERAIGAVEALADNATALERERYEARHMLARLLRDIDRPRAVSLYEEGLRRHEMWSVKELLELDQSFALKLSLQLAEEGDAWSLAMMAPKMPGNKRAIEICRKLADEKDFWGMNALGELIEDDDPGAAELFYRATEDYDNLAHLNKDAAIQGLEGEIAKERAFEKEGALYRSDYLDDLLFALAKLVEDEDPTRAIDLYEEAMGRGSFYAKRELLRIDKRCVIAFYEGEVEHLKQIVVEDASGAGSHKKTDLAEREFDLACLLEETDPERAWELYENAFELGLHTAITGMVRLDGERAIPLLEKEVVKLLDGEGRDVDYLLFELAEVDENRAADLCMRRAQDGDLLPLFLLSNLVRSMYKDQAIEICKKLADADDAFAIVTLARLIETDDKERAIELLNYLISHHQNAAAIDDLDRLTRRVPQY